MITLALATLFVIAVRCSGPIASDSESPSSVPLTVSQVCERVPGARGARRLHPATVTRWILSGCPARDGKRVRLPATRAGSRWLVRPEDLDNFFTALAAETPSLPPVPQKNAEQRNRASRRAAEELARRGA